MRLTWARELRDGAARFARATVLRALPVRAYLELAIVLARFRAKRAVVPEHVRENLRAAFATERSPAEIEQMAQRHVEFRAYLGFQRRVLALRGISGFRVCSVAGVEQLDEALALGRGVVLVSAHVGYPHLIVPILRARGVAVSRVTSRPLFVADIAAGLDVRPIFKALVRNESVLILGDGMHAVQFAKLTLLGNDCLFPTGFMKIAIATGAPILPVWSLPGDRRTGIRVEIHPPLEIDPGASLTSNLEVFVRLLERQLRRTPHLWTRWVRPDVFGKAIQWSRSDLRDRKPAGRSARVSRD